jgi:aspartyl-tRNA(Asn)/glutamyl-tRNA(Gln) amidotransferase subunit B
MEYEPVIGLEIHAELKTKTKMFCDCLNNSDEKEPNKNICPVCLGHPGTLPVINKKAVEAVIKVGLALESEVPEFSKFDRKNYFYPDLPKGYQISQYDEPLCRGGKLKLFLSNDHQESLKEIDITRVHLEEDAGKLIHPEDKNLSRFARQNLVSRSARNKKSTLIDFNRAGVPLMELVTEPVIHTGKEARLFSQGLQLLLKTLRVSEADMEKGQMRCEVNISLKPKNQKELGTKVEVKNLNSFRAVERAIDYEIKRQIDLLDDGEKIIQETRGWDQVKEITYSQRSKEEAQDYRYFPEPDLPPLHLYSKTKEGGLFDLEQMKSQLPELPWQKKQNLIQIYNIPSQRANLLVQDDKALLLFRDTVTKLDPKNRERGIPLVCNYLTTDILGIKEKEDLTWEDIKLSSDNFSQLINNLASDTVSSRVGKDILLDIIHSNQNVGEIIKTKGLEKISDQSVLIPTINEVIKNNHKAIEDYKKGKENALQFLVGQAMAKLKGAADPEILEQLIKDKLRG